MKKKISFNLPDDLYAKIQAWVEEHPRMNQSDCINLALMQFLESNNS